MSCCNVSKYINPACAGFVVAVMFSVASFIVSVMGLAGLISFPGSACYWTSILSGCIGLWMTPPKIRSNDEKSDIYRLEPMNPPPGQPLKMNEV